MVPDGVTLNTPTSVQTNRLALGGTGSTYDGGGNLTKLATGGETYTYDYDAVGMMKHLRSSTDQARVYLYTADDERLVTIDCPQGSCASTDDTTETWTLRDLSGQVLRTYRHLWGEHWQWTTDYVHRQGQPLAAIHYEDGAQVTSTSTSTTSVRRGRSPAATAKWRCTRTTPSVKRRPIRGRAGCG